MTEKHKNKSKATTKAVNEAKDVAQGNERDNEKAVVPVPEASLRPEDAQIVIHQHFVNDLSIENPVGVLDSRAAQARLGQQVSIDVAPRQGAPETFKRGEPTHQVTVGIQLSANLGEATIYLAEMRYRALVEVRNLSPEEADPALFVTVPSAMFPALKEVMERNGSYAGYPGLTVQPIDFAMIHETSTKRQAANAAAAVEAEGKTKH